MIWRICRKHLALTQPKSVLDNFQYSYGTALDCKVCRAFNHPTEWKGASPLESRAYTAIRSLNDSSPTTALADTEWHTDVRILPTEHTGDRAPCAAIYVPKYRLCIMVDSKLHFENTKTKTWNQKNVLRTGVWSRSVANDVDTFDGFIVSAIDGSILNNEPLWSRVSR